MGPALRGGVPLRPGSTRVRVGAFALTQPQFVTGAGSNDPVYSSPAFDAKLIEAERALDPNQSYALVNRAQAILMHDLPVIPLWDYTAAGGVGPGVTAQLTWNGLADFTQIIKGDVAENTEG